MDYDHEKSQFFITELSALKRNSAVKTKETMETSINADDVCRNLNLTLQDASNNDYSALLDPQMFSNKSTSRRPLLTSTSIKKVSHTRGKSNSVTGMTSPTVSRYANIATENLKFKIFAQALFSSKMTLEDMRDEMKAYVSVLETNYTDTIRELKD